MFLKIKKGIDLKLAGKAGPDAKVQQAKVSCVAMIPDDFPGMWAKLDVAPGDKVDVGTPLWHDKNDTDIKVVSPVSGTVSEIVRGEKRKILRVIIECSQNDGVAGSVKSETLAPNTDEEIKSIIKASGLWAMMRQLPFDIVPVDNRKPVNIFVSAWDAAPLSPGFAYYLDEKISKDVADGVEALKHCTSGKIYIGYEASTTFPNLQDCEKVAIEGHYPASLPSVLAANTVPVNKGETVWLLSVETVARIGQAVKGATVDWTFPVGVVGSEIESPGIVRTVAGANVKEILDVCPKKCCGYNTRLISGNVFVGEKIEDDGFLRYPYRQLTAIPEGDDRADFMGWASMSPSKISVSRSFPSFFMRKKEFSPDARLNGGRRAIIMSGEYDRYIPMDIMAEYLIKAILARNIERMEQLGIYEITPGDFSAAEYADTSKLELQKIVREGLDFMIKEVGTGD